MALKTDMQAHVSPVKGTMQLEKQNLACKIDMQLLTISYIEDLESQAAGTKVVKRKLSKELQGEDDGDGRCLLDIPETHTLGRSGRKYFNWAKRLMQDLMHFVEPSVFPLPKCRVDSVLMIKQLMEYGLGIKCLKKSTSDTCLHNGKKVTFDSLKSLYDDRGSRFKKVNPGRHGRLVQRGGVQRPHPDRREEAQGQGHREVHRQDRLHPGQVHHRWLSNAHEARDIKENYSNTDAYVFVGEADHMFQLSQLFPKSRTLVRKDRDAIGATAGAPETENLEDAKAEEAEEG